MISSFLQTKILSEIKENRVHYEKLTSTDGGLIRNAVQMLCGCPLLQFIRRFLYLPGGQNDRPMLSLGGSSNCYQIVRQGEGCGRHHCRRQVHSTCNNDRSPSTAALGVKVRAEMSWRSSRHHVLAVRGKARKRKEKIRFYDLTQDQYEYLPRCWMSILSLSKKTIESFFS